MGALRLGKFAKYLLAQGHDIRVISARDVRRPMTLPLEIPEARIERTRWWDVNALPAAAAALRNRLKGSADGDDRGADAGTGTTNESPGMLRGLAEIYAGLVNLPDANIGWLPHALAAGRRAVKTWKPDVIFASAPPFTALIAGHLLGTRYRIPWVAEFRDRWVDDPYYPPPRWRRRLEGSLERRLITSASGLVTVSEPWAEAYRAKYDKPTAVIYNGFDPDDYGPESPGAGASEKLTLAYTGRIYPGRRDPSPVFQAIKIAGLDEGVVVDFYGPDDGGVTALARRHEISHAVRVHSHVPYEESLAIQQQSDVLLFMQWNDPKEQGNVPGKLFEYLGARRPILGLGLETGVPARIIRERAAGLFSNDPEVIARQLDDWRNLKRKNGTLEALPETVGDGFSRNEQFAKLEAFLAQTQN